MKDIGSAWGIKSYIVSVKVGRVVCVWEGSVGYCRFAYVFILGIGGRVYRIFIGDNAGSRSSREGATREGEWGCCVLCAGPLIRGCSIPNSWASLAMSIGTRRFSGVIGPLGCGCSCEGVRRGRKGGRCAQRASPIFPRHFMSVPRALPDVGRESGVFAGDVRLGCQILQKRNRSVRGGGCCILSVIHVFPSICMGREDGWSVCLCCGNQREFTFALWSSVKGVHGEVGVGCRVSWGA